MGKFADSVRANAQKSLARVNVKCYEIARELFSEVVYRSPSKMIGSKYAHGHLKNQWWPQNGATYNTSLTPATDQSGSGSINRISMLMGFEFLGKDGVVTLTNSLPYAVQAERIGWARTGPYRMVYTSIQATASKYK